MAIADVVYNEIGKRILSEGTWDTGMKVRPVWVSDGTPAHSIYLTSARMFFDNTETALLTQKKVGWKTSIKEGPFWIWQEKDNSVDRLNQMGVHIWDDWRQPDGTIGKAYGYQLAKRTKKVKLDAELYGMLQTGFLSGAKAVRNDRDSVLLDQVDYLLYSLKTNPASRRHITMLWNWEDIDDMALTPCVYETQWVVRDGHLDLIVGIRSNDWAVGNPFNTFQYQVLQRMIAQVTGFKLGTLEFNISMPHIYERHVEEIKNQMDSPMYEAPVLHINEDVTSFYQFKMKDFKLEGYEHGPKREFEIAK